MNEERRKRAEKILAGYDAEFITNTNALMATGLSRKQAEKILLKPYTNAVGEFVHNLLMAKKIMDEKDGTR